MIGKLPENRNTILSLINQTGRLGVIIYSFPSTTVSFCYVDEWGKQLGGGRSTGGGLQRQEAKERIWMCLSHAYAHNSMSSLSLFPGI